MNRTKSRALKARILSDEFYPVKFLQLLLLLFSIGLASEPSDASAQTPEKVWQVLDSFPAPISVIRFLDHPGPPRVGFVGTLNMVYRTIDGGLTWKNTTSDDYNFQATDFTFKDSMTGWFCNALDDTTVPSCYMTTDGGLSWQSIRTCPSHRVWSMLYRPSNKLLLVAGWAYNDVLSTSNSSYSTDEGKTWKIFFSGSDLNGFAFMDDNLGISGFRKGTLYFARTTDGGFTWAPVTTSPDESYQPLADTIRHLFWAATDYTHQLWVSSDGGNNFVVPPPNTILQSPGTLLMGGCGDLYAQESIIKNSDSWKGIVISTNGGQNWNGIQDKNARYGPAAANDNRFFIKGGYIYAPEQIDGKSYVLWRYVGDSTDYGDAPVARPFASTNDFHIVTHSCTDLDTQLTISFSNPCMTAELDDAYFEPTGRFFVELHDALPHPLSGYYPLTIQHRPQSQQRDTANLVLVEKVGGALTYDTIRVSGEVPSSKTVAVDVFVNNTKSVTTKPGDTVGVTFRLMDAVPGTLGLDSIQVETIFDGSMMDQITYNILPPWSLLHESHSAGVEQLAVRHTHGEDLAANTDIAQILYRTYLTPNGTGAYTFDKIQFNDSVLTGCVQATALMTPATISVSTCGDTTLRGFMDGLPLARLMSIVVNDDQYALKISTIAPMPLTIAIFNILGAQVHTMQLTSTGNGEQLVPLDTHGLPSGSYWLSLTARGGASTQPMMMTGRFFLAD